MVLLDSLGYLRVLISGPNRGGFSKLKGPSPLRGQEVTQIPLSALADFMLNGTALGVMCCISNDVYSIHRPLIPFVFVSIVSIVQIESRTHDLNTQNRDRQGSTSKLSFESSAFRLQIQQA